MTEFKSIPFEPGHAEELIGQADINQAEKKFLLGRHIHDLSSGYSISVIRNGHLLGSGGIFPIWDGLGEAWVIPSELVQKHKKMFVKLIRENMARMTDEFQFRRLQATARADAPKSRRFLEFLGFEREGLLKAYGPDGADHVLFAKIRKG
jgi:RimJ/RimL family protein N-acetyltransferase